MTLQGAGEAPLLQGKILIIDDEPAIRTTVAGVLADEGHRVLSAPNGAHGLRLATKELPEVCFLDVWLPDVDGMELLGKIRTASPETLVIMISGHANIETAVRCTRLGATDFIEKPLSLEKILISVQNALRIKSLKNENQSLRGRVEQKYKLIGVSAQLDAIRNTIEMVSKRNSTVLITGENGTGKENVARNIHEHSLRAKKPFVAVNCAAIPEELIESELFGHEKGAFTGATAVKRGKFELASGGTLFLDEIGDMSVKTQSKLLRVLQETKFERLGGTDSIAVDVRIIAATNKDLGEEIKRGGFREDLFYRLNVIPIAIPPLRERHPDILLIAKHYLDFYSLENSVRPKALSPAAAERLQTHDWPGNIRELKNMMERLSILVPEDEILPRHLPLPAAEADFSATHPLERLLRHDSFREARAEFERLFIAKKLEDCGQNITRTAELIGMERSHLYRKLKQFDPLLDASERILGFVPEAEPEEKNP